MRSHQFRIGTVLLSVCLVGVACGAGPTPPETELWAADLDVTNQVLQMTLVFEGDGVSGNGSLSSLTSVGGFEPLTVTGNRWNDSLAVIYRREELPPFEFRGRYLARGLAGVLHGAEFDSVRVLFRSG